MSVYIKGIDVPKEGTVIVIDSTGQVWSNEWPTRGYTRIDGAKAVPVPEHGRLIDADALIAWFEEWYDPNADLEICHVIDILDDNSVTPTIIPAEPPKEEE